MSTRPILLYVLNEPTYFISHRLPIALAAREDGYELHVASSADADAVAAIRGHGITFHELALSRGSMNPLSEMWTLAALLRLFLRLRPRLVHMVTIKPVVYGGIAARLARVPAIVSAVSGLGFIFVSGESAKARALRRFVLGLYRVALGHPNQRVIFQNPDDRAMLLDNAGLDRSKTTLIRGSGVNLARYSCQAEPEGVPVVSLASRLLRDKGIVEFVEAARLLRARGVAARFQLIGDVDPHNPASVTREELDAWRREGIVECLGYRTDVPELFARSHIVTLPSYYGEGLPKVLIEAAACGRPVVTTDMPGCRDAIEADVSGLLVPPRDAAALADALERLIVDADLRRRMGEAGRVLAETAFDIDQVVATHVAIYRELAARAQSGEAATHRAAAE